MTKESIKDFKHIEAVVKKGKSVINLFTNIDEYSAREFVAEFKWLERESSEIEIRINSVGGSVVHGWSMVDTILNSKVPTVSVVVGVAASMATVVMAATNETKMMDYASCMVHNPFSTSGEAEEQQLTTFRNQLLDLYEKRWGIARLDIEAMIDGKDGNDGTWMKADEALKLGIISEIISISKQDKEVLKNLVDIAACAGEADKLQATFQEYNSKINSNKNLSKMIEEINATVGLPKEASVDTLNAKVKDIFNRNAELVKANSALEIGNKAAEAELKKVQASLDSTVAEVENLQAEVKAFKDAKEAAEKAEREALVADAVAEGKISEEDRETWVNLVNANFEAAKTAIEKMTVAELGGKKKLSAEVKAEVREDKSKAPTYKTMSQIMSEINEQNKAKL